MKNGSEGGGQPLGGGGEQAVDAARVPISEELVWKSRAEEAEEKAAALERQLARLQQNLDEANAAVEAGEIRRQIERELTESDALDLEACCMLTEAAVSQMEEPDVALAVRDLRKRKPFLFQGQSGSAHGATMVPAGAAVDELGEMADRARSSGDRAALLRYLRQRRG